MGAFDLQTVRFKGITYDIDWSRWEPGASVFIPCIDAPGLRDRVIRKARQMDVRLVSRIVIEDQHFGVRFWRVA